MVCRRDSWSRRGFAIAHRISLYGASARRNLCSSLSSPLEPRTPPARGRVAKERHDFDALSSDDREITRCQVQLGAEVRDQMRRHRDIAVSVVIEVGACRDNRSRFVASRRATTADS